MTRIRGSREGTSLVELLVAIMLVGVVVTSLGGMSFQAARQSVVLAGDGYLQGIVTQEVNRLQGMPFTQLPTGSTCLTVSTGSFPHTRCYTVTSVAVWHKSVTLTVTPAQTGVKPFTVTFSRYEPSSYNPLNFP
ncbi:MAG: hypothetical protein L0271_21415 [Gemmatimonadetes bacterium]|nr:hypothetical protein [Gemmatimonadota bacterium]